MNLKNQDKQERKTVPFAKFWIGGTFAQNVIQKNQQKIISEKDDNPTGLACFATLSHG